MLQFLMMFMDYSEAVEFETPVAFMIIGFLLGVFIGLVSVKRHKIKVSGSLLILNKIIWKIPTDEISGILAESSDIPDLHGQFKFDGEEVFFKAD